MRKKLLIGLLVCGIVGDGGVCAHELWVTPYSLTAEFTGKKPYIYDTLSELPTDDYVGCGFCEAVKRLDGRSLAHDPL